MKIKTVCEYDTVTWFFSARLVFLSLYSTRSQKCRFIRYVRYLFARSNSSPHACLSREGSHSCCNNATTRGVANATAPRNSRVESASGHPCVNVGRPREADGNSFSQPSVGTCHRLGDRIASCRCTRHLRPLGETRRRAGIHFCVTRTRLHVGVYVFRGKRKSVTREVSGEEVR